MLRHTRSVLVRAPHVKLHNLRRLDDRIAANLDGVAVAGETGRELCTTALETPWIGQAFAAAAAAIEAADHARLARIFALAATVPDVRRGLLSALAWWPAPQCQSLLRRLLSSFDEHRSLALSAHRLHGLDPGPMLQASLSDPQVQLRASAARAAGELGRLDLVDALLDAMNDDDAETAWQATRSVCLLGRRRAVFDRLWREQASAWPWADAALALLIQCADFPHAQDIVRAVAKASPTSTPSRRLVRAVGWLGDTALVPWLINLMDQPHLTRLAGESLSMIAGVDLAAMDLEVKPPAVMPAGPNDDPEDTDVALDEDDSLPWPDAAKLKVWWPAQSARFPRGVRYFMGAPPSAEQALQVLKTGCQRQRALAAQWRCLLRAGTPLWNVAAPAWRQQQALAASA